ncbi:MAG: pilus assembly PilX N-terminal domain-containing protein [Desulfosoma sp.]
MQYRKKSSQVPERLPGVFGSWDWRIWKRKDGMALTLVLVIIAALAVLTVGLALDQAIEMRLAGNRKAAETAFRNAESGLAVAQERLARWFATDPMNLQRQRTGSATLPDWDFLFLNATPYTGSNNRKDLYDEVKLDLGWDHRFKVFARIPEDRKDDAFQDLFGENTRLVLRSVGFGPAGSQQETEMMVEAVAEPSPAFAYAQEGLGSVPSHVNMRDKNAVRATGQPLAVVP